MWCEEEEEEKLLGSQGGRWVTAELGGTRAAQQPGHQRARGGWRDACLASCCATFSATPGSGTGFQWGGTGCLFWDTGQSKQLGGGGENPFKSGRGLLCAAPLQHEPEPSATPGSPQRYFAFRLTLHSLPRPLTALPREDTGSKPEPRSTARS